MTAPASALTEWLPAAAAAKAVATDLEVSEDAVLIACHAVVLAALTGEPEVAFGVRRNGSDPAPCRLAVDQRSWRDLLRVATNVVEDLAARIGRPTSTGDPVIIEGIPQYAAGARDDGAVERLLGYHRSALAALRRDPDADPRSARLISDAERRHQLTGMAGPDRPLPDRRFHQLFEEQVAAHPEKIAAVCGDQQLSYGELNRRANRVARALRAEGLPDEAVVAVVTERNLDWLVSVLAVFKAGAAYLPIEPGFPADRIATTLRRSGCSLVLTEVSDRRGLPDALAALAVDGTPPTRLLVADTYAAGHDDRDLGLPVRPDQLAYIYFTSGSTGLPKGAMCEHEGMVNHLLAKIEDLGISPDDVVAQTAPQCFDISLWQLVAALMVGGRTAIIEQAVILDVERMVDRLVASRVAVLQLVPSYLEVVLTYLERHPRELPDLRVVSVTGEAVKAELVQRWFAGRPGIALMNAYGLTETSDDTNHEVMHAAPEGRVPLGRPIRNVTVYVVDPDLEPVPLGAPGEIVFSGVCVGRGYVNDPVRTAAAFGADPHRPGQRLYRSGDFGRWLPDGKLEFLGRRDTQLKINGFRIEIGEIENTLLRQDGIRDGAVVVTEDPVGGKRLVGFYAADRELDHATLTAGLATSLPHYMVPGTLHRRASLPLSSNGKIDRRALTELAVGLGASLSAGQRRRPSTSAELRVAAAWARALGTDASELRVDDHFFDRGGSSLSAVKVVIGLNRAVTLQDLMSHPVLADLAAVLDRAAAPAASTPPASRALLQTLTETPDGGDTVICLPWAGGNAVSFQPLARALAGSGVGVLAVEYPGHDLTSAREPFASLEQVVDRVAAELGDRGVRAISCWGHSAGAAAAVALCRRLEADGLEVRQLFLGAQLLRTTEERRASTAGLAGRSDAELAAALGAATPGMESLEPDRAEHVGAAYRHDLTEANRYLADLATSPPAVRLRAAVTTVVAADDLSTADAVQRYRDWQLVAEDVELVALVGGGHHFLRTRPEETAAVVRRALERVPAR